MPHQFVSIKKKAVRPEPSKEGMIDAELVQPIQDTTEEMLKKTLRKPIADKGEVSFLPQIENVKKPSVLTISEIIVSKETDLF